jgi:hypothetical protein
MVMPSCIRKFVDMFGDIENLQVPLADLKDIAT